MINIPQNQYKELIQVCKDTKTEYKITYGALFNFIKIEKIIIACHRNSGQILFSFKEGQQAEL